MFVLDGQYNSRLNDYITTRFEQYMNWYVESIKIARNNLLAALVVIVTCALCLSFIPSSIDQMSFFQYSFDPTLAIQLGLFISALLALFSMFTSYKMMKNCLAGKVLLQSEYALFFAREDDSGLNDEAAFAAFVDAVDGIITATNTEAVIDISQGNVIKAEVREASKL